MRFNESQIKEIAARKGDQEGRMIYKSPSKPIYEKSSYKEKWFKLQGNLLFYYHLNVDKTVGSIEPDGVYILENITVEKELEDLKHPFGFAVKWKDDPYRIYRFFAPSEKLQLVWISKFLRASYENMRAELLVLRLQIQRKSGKDPLEHLGTPLPFRSIRGMLASPSKATSFKSYLGLAPSSSETRLSLPEGNGNPNLTTAKSAPNTPCIVTKFDSVSIPTPPPRTNKERRKLSGKESKNSIKSVSPSDPTFTSHVMAPELKSSGSFKSHIKLSEDELREFLN